MSWHRGRSLLPFLAILASCDRAAPERPSPPALAATEAPRAPARTLGRRTTSGLIAVRNLDGQIASAEAVLQRGPATLQAQQNLVGLLLTRGQALGILADYDRAEEIAQGALDAASVSAGALELRASVSAVFHEFDAALADLQEAERLGASGDSLKSARASIYAATGRSDEALALVKALAQERPTITSLATLGSLHGDRGELAIAERRFAEALAAYRNVSPFPVSWVAFQQGLMYERAGRSDDARRLYEEALARLPVNAQAASHLAALEASAGDRRKAIELLGRVMARSDDPELVGQRAALARDEGDRAQADALTARAASRYDALMARHPNAFADHAARFWLGIGGDAGKALVLAEKNLSVRRTTEAHELVLSAALGAGAGARACEVADQVLRAPHPGADLLLLVRNAFNACGRSADVARVNARLTH